MIHDYTVILSDIDCRSVEIAPFVYIGKNVHVGKNVVIHPHVTIDEGAIIGDDVEIYPGTYIGKPPKGPCLGSHTTYEKRLSVGSGCVIGPNATLYYGVRIGKFTLLSDGVSIRENTVVGSHCIIGRNTTINYGVTIEDHVKIMDLTHITARTIIRERAFIGPGVFSADDNQFGKSAPIKPVGGAEIKQNASIGVGAVLLPCVEIGEDAVVAAGSIVTKNVPDATLVMGVAAKQVDSHN